MKSYEVETTIKIVERTTVEEESAHRARVKAEDDAKALYKKDHPEATITTTARQAK
jgi:hypothetical protein